MKIPREIQAELETAPGRWNVVSGTRHHKIYVDNVLCGILPLGTNKDYKRATLNVRAQIRRHLKGRKS